MNEALVLSLRGRNRDSLIERVEARIYDMTPRPPVQNEGRMAEPKSYAGIREGAACCGSLRCSLSLLICSCFLRPARPHDTLQIANPTEAPGQFRLRHPFRRCSGNTRTKRRGWASARRRRAPLKPSASERNRRHQRCLGGLY